MICDRWETVVVSFPFIDAPVSKPRPALILSARPFNAENGHSILAMITRAKASAWPSDHVIADPSAAGLRDSSVVRWKLFTLDNRILQRRIGQLAARDVTACAEIARSIFLDPSGRA